MQLGQKNKFVTESAKKNIYWACKSPYLRSSVKKGQLLSEDMIDMKRPFSGTKMQDVFRDDHKSYFTKDVLEGNAILSDDISMSSKNELTI